MLEKLGPLDADRIAGLGPYLESVPDPRSRRGRWYSLTAILLMCACAAVCGAKSIERYSPVSGSQCPSIQDRRSYDQSESNMENRTPAIPSGF
ncbi:transposase family protein [Streptomyces sp. NBC_01456]|uniref:transposase family protein n=1 Tax=unclassified Streptomyces TaxID=2593676 RepID=UPI002E364648|nr:MULTISPECIES: transposase family protein [unclassified Streptomyces]